MSLALMGCPRAPGEPPVPQPSQTALPTAERSLAQFVVVSPTRGPYLQQVGRRSALVVWETAESSEGVVTVSTQGVPDRVVRDEGKKARHVVKLAGLSPGTAYRYRLGNGGMGASGVFTTEPDRISPYRAVVFGDTRTNHEAHRNVIKSILQDAPRLVFHSGDLVVNPKPAEEWNAFFGVEGDLLRSAPLYPALGNHEGDGERFVELFELPGEERYYDVRYGVTYFAVLDQYTSHLYPGSPQFRWLEASLKAASEDPSVRQRIVILHQGPYSSGPHGSSMTARTELVPLFERYRVDVVFSGHDHGYERSTVNGIKYVVSGGGGAPLYQFKGASWTEVTESSLHHCVLDVHGARMTVVVRRSDRSMLDSFTIHDNLSECRSDLPCEGRPEGSCGEKEQGRWQCVQNACIWDCT